MLAMFHFTVLFTGRGRVAVHQGKCCESVQSRAEVLRAEGL